MLNEVNNRQILEIVKKTEHFRPHSFIIMSTKE